MSVIDTGALLDVVSASLVADAVITGAFSLGLYGVSRYGEARRAGRGSEAFPFAVIGGVGAALFVAAVVVGFAAMIST